MTTSTLETTFKPLPKQRAFDLQGLSFTTLSGVATLIIAAMVAVIMGNIILNGWSSVTWEFLSGAPREGMTRGGIFPAIYGTVLLVLLMVVALVPFGNQQTAWWQRNSPVTALD